MQLNYYTWTVCAGEEIDQDTQTSCAKGDLLVFARTLVRDDCTHLRQCHTYFSVTHSLGQGSHMHFVVLPVYVLCLHLIGLGRKYIHTYLHTYIHTSYSESVFIGGT